MSQLLGAAWAQDTVRYGDSNYFFMPWDSVDSYLNRRSFGSNIAMCTYLENYVSEPLLVYGVAVVSPYRPKYYQNVAGSGWSSDITVDMTGVDLDLRAMLTVKEGRHYYHLDSSKWNSSRMPDKYFLFELPIFDSTHYNIVGYFDSLVPVYEFYFNTPREVCDTFYVGLYSNTANYDIYSNYVNCTYGWIVDPWRYGYNVTSMWELVSVRMRSLYGQAALRELHGTKYIDGGYEYVHDYHRIGLAEVGAVFPILVPLDTDSFECTRVENFRRTGYVGGRPLFDWSMPSGGQPCQIAFGPADQGVENHTVANTIGHPFVLPPGDYDSTVLYVARCRRRCHHACAVHDTIVWSEWSDTVEFWTGSRRPGSEGIEMPIGEKYFVLSPNPARGRVTMTLGEGAVAPGVVRLCDEQGRELLRRRMEGHELVLPTGGLPAGLYFVTLETPAGSSTQKLVLEQ